ncbi:DUF421 domain-containing protein [Nocardia farcinica]|uniref:DUF421 domain-containing protein n=1 Tax=Nocardia farcinica TaxID=37329 RepID=UPI002453F146|nr:YetF domain-containing protein [Nocardia farcinica]
MSDWNILLPSTSPWELVVRGTVTFLVLMALFRVIGQREAGGLGLTDLLVVVLVAQAAGPGMLGDAATVADSMIVVVTMLGWSLVIDALAYRWPRLARIAKARPRTLIADGQLNRRVMRREFMTYDEVMSQLRLHGIAEIGHVKRAYLEPNGMVSVLPRDGHQSIDPPSAVPR